MSTPLVQVELEKIDLILYVLERYHETGKIESKHKVYNLFEHDLNFPSGDEALLKIMCHPYVLLKYLDYLCWRLLNNIGEERLNRRTTVFSNYIKSSDDECIRIRRFNPIGTYCGIPFVVDDGCFFFWNDEPLLVTKYMKNQLLEQPPGFPLRQEVRIMSAIAFSLQRGAYSFSLSYDTYDIPADILGENYNFCSNSRIQSIIRIFDRLTNVNFNMPFTNPGKFDFSTQDYHLEKAKNFYHSFNIMDELALRTCFLLIKSKMLWDGGRLYSEDACTNLFVSIEGALRLIYQRITGKSNFSIKPTTKHIAAVFPNGEFWIDLLDDIYNKRVQIVHPAEAKWMPELADDDFYDNYEIAIDLIFYAISGELLPREY